ncbi:D-alanyl-D-alanine endopeptidase [Burkholderia multivorans]|uniref:D-alanyl-D-alanine endopeptidase n=2 Tax=Burkholderia multivorans TaxID=87883 RepID=A0A8E2RXE3_9BURK|nr:MULTISPECIES: D-alanyl-D-alanine endopeptidase [Burkholderia]AOJ92471.1 D-alanyl-D-alanine carboxypeptidase [Burkholderia multivorans]AVR22584.1 D-alanyl-D-alanine endopeptidase [Burkholderia multivorans]EEE03618.1 D-alanyl-D-alanine carboxypeptidase family protein [Burkholderia multivorans CGD2]EEE14771.1 D-alanyl-D-alanine carboxypeptidase family protein [Burkholderia multivorans CGD2M]EJO61567.1 serine-type D-Ala-D-Ala carboxypeptidase [Burkholderia multivorans ATCC BAA-247]
MKAESFSPRRLLQSMTLGTAVSVAVALLATAASVTPADAFAATAKTHHAAKKAASPAKQKAASGKSAKVAAAEAPRAKASRKRVTLAANVRGGHHGAVRRVAFQPRQPTVGQAFGLHDTPDALALRSSVAYVVDQNTGEPLFDKNSHAVVPIASISKLMTAMVVLDSKAPMTEQIEVTDEDRDYEKGTGSRLSVGSVLSREDMLHIALMASENRAAAALSRYYPGGRPAFIAAMNAKAKALGMTDTHFENSTGLSSSNVSSARDLVKMVNAAYQYPLIRKFSTDRTYEVYTGKRNLVYNSTNALIRGNGSWDIGLQKTGFINEAGECLVMQATIHGRPVVMVLLDSFGKYSRFADASRLRNWLDAGGGERLTAANTPAGGT